MERQKDLTSLAFAEDDFLDLPGVQNNGLQSYKVTPLLSFSVQHVHTFGKPLSLEVAARKVIQPTTTNIRRKIPAGCKIASIKRLSGQHSLKQVTISDN